MSHSIFDGLSVVSLDGTGLTVQQLLDSTLIQNTVSIEDQNVTSTNTSVEQLNSNYTSISVIDEDLSFDDNDLFQCGRCKLQFSSLESFMVHKRSQCSCLKVKKEISNQRSIPSSSSSRGCDSPAQVSSSDAHKEGDQSQSQRNQEKYFCSLVTDTPDSQSVVINDGEFFNLTLDGAQVFTLPDNLGLGGSENGKIVGSKNGEALFRTTTALIREEGDTQLSSTSLPCIMTTEEVSEGGNESSLGIKTENGLDSTLVVPIIASEESKTYDYNRILFHGRMAKGTNNKTVASRKHICMFCNKTFTKNFDLQQHIRSHTGEKPFQCIVCGRAFAQKSNVKKHMSTHKVWPKDSVCNTLPKEPIKKVLSLSSGNESGDESNAVKEEFLVDNSYVCPFCSLVHTSYLELRTHMKQHKDQKVYRCIQKECDETFAELDAFLDHTKSSHDKQVQYRCHTCSKLFESLHALGFHQFEHSIYPWPKKSGPSYFRCTKCMNKYASVEALDHHLKMTKHHFPCKQCSRIFSSERLLRAHLRVHGNVNLFTCVTCSKDLKSEHSLKVHQLIHTGERPFECHICSASFNRKDKLKRHLLVHEPKKFKCFFNSSLGCQREFSRKDKLRLHLLSHTHASSRKRGGTKAEEKREVSLSAIEVDSHSKDVTQNELENSNEHEIREQASIKQESSDELSGCPETAVEPTTRILQSDNRDEISKPKLCETETKIRIKKHGVGKNNAVNEVKCGHDLAPSTEEPTSPVEVNTVTIDTRQNDAVKEGSLQDPAKNKISPKNTMDDPSHTDVLEASYEALAVNDVIMTSYSDDDDSEALEENVEIIYIPFALDQNDFIETVKKEEGTTPITLAGGTTPVTLPRGTTPITLTGGTGTSPDSDESFFVSTEEMENLEDISAEILLSESTLGVINDNVGINDGNSFFVVKGVDPESDGVDISFDDTRTIILENKEGNDDFRV